MSFAFHELDSDTLLYEERVSPWLRAFIAGIGLTMLVGSVAFLALFATLPFPTFTAAFCLLGSALFFVLGVFLFRLGWQGPGTRIRFDGREHAFVCSEFVPLGQYKESRHLYREVADVRVKTHDFEGSPPDYTVEIRMKGGSAIGCGCWDRRSEAKAWADNLRTRLIRDA